MKIGKFELTGMMAKYLVQLLVRLFIFLVVLMMYLLHKDLLISFMTHSFTQSFLKYDISFMHIVWFVFMVMMIRHLHPTELMSMALRKGEPETYKEKIDYSEHSLLRFVQHQNKKAWIVMLVWLCFNAIFGVLYLFGVIREVDLLMLSVFFFLSDYICIIFFCPFQTFIMKNKCCVNCRIYDWGHFMMFTPMLFIKNFFSWSLFFTSCIVLIRWELVYASHPERFWSGSNKTLDCNTCKDKTCQIKTLVSGPVKSDFKG